MSGTCENLLKIVAINESLHLGSEKSPPYGRAQRLTRPKCAILGKITRHIKTFFGRFQREERKLFYQFLRVSLRGSARLAILKKKKPPANLKSILKSSQLFSSFFGRFSRICSSFSKRIRNQNCVSAFHLCTLFFVCSF